MEKQNDLTLFQSIFTATLAILGFWKLVEIFFFILKFLVQHITIN